MHSAGPLCEGPWGAKSGPFSGVKGDAVSNPVRRPLLVRPRSLFCLLMGFESAMSAASKVVSPGRKRM